MSNETQAPHASAASSRTSFITAAYTEVCRSYHAVDDFRMKLLGLLPAASVIGLLALAKSMLSTPLTPIEREVIAYIGVFTALFTLALFGYEVRGILMCHDLYVTGARLEKEMELHGQFALCDEARGFSCYDGRLSRPLSRLANGTITPCAIYSLVFAAWLFFGLRYGFSLASYTCVLCAGLTGGILTGVSAYFLNHITSQPPSSTKAFVQQATIEAAT